MKNCMENPNHVWIDLREFLPNPPTKDVEQSDSVDPSQHMEADGPCSKPEGVTRRRTQSEGLGGGGHPLLRDVRSTQSLDTPDVIRNFTGNSYLLLIGEEDGKASVIVFGLRSRAIFQKRLDTGKKPGHLRATCCCYAEEAPFLCFLYSSLKHAVDLVAYDVIEAKYKSRAKPGVKCEFGPLVNMGNSMLCFRRKSDTVDTFSIARNKWGTPIQLHQTVDLPVVVSLEERIVYIFHGKLVQIYDVVTKRVTSAPISDFVASGYGFAFNSLIYILSDASLFVYDPTKGDSKKYDFPHLNFQPIHEAFVRYNQVFVLITNSAGKFEILRSEDLCEWQRVLSFPRRLDLTCTEVVDYRQPCPIPPFQTFNESLKQKQFTLS